MVRNSTRQAMPSLDLGPGNGLPALVAGYLDRARPRALRDTPRRRAGVAPTSACGRVAPRERERRQFRGAVSSPGALFFRIDGLQLVALAAHAELREAALLEVRIAKGVAVGPVRPAEKAPAGHVPSEDRAERPV